MRKVLYPTPLHEFLDKEAAAVVHDAAVPRTRGTFDWGGGGGWVAWRVSKVKP